MEADIAFLLRVSFVRVIFASASKPREEKKVGTLWNTRNIVVIGIMTCLLI